jgi:transcription elongation factor Elf1
MKIESCSVILTCEKCGHEETISEFDVDEAILQCINCGAVYNCEVELRTEFLPTATNLNRRLKGLDNVFI